MNFIKKTNRKVTKKKGKKKNCTKDILNISKLAILTIVMISMTFLGNFKPVYEVYAEGKSLGYISSKQDFQNMIKNNVLTLDEENVVAADLNIKLSYEYKLKQYGNTNEDSILEYLKDYVSKTYKVYAINLNNKTEAYLKNWEEAEEIVEEMQEECEDIENTEITVVTKYTSDLDEFDIDNVEDAKLTMENNLRELKDEQVKIAEATYHGVYFGVKPVDGIISSRYGAVESVRNHTHMGLDIRAPLGTPIKAAADGVVSFAGNSGGYGNLIKIEHSDEVQSCYGHCSKIYVSEGDEVKAGDVIGAVGATGYATGNHLHFEIRLNGSPVNPQICIYK